MSNAPSASTRACWASRSPSSSRTQGSTHFFFDIGNGNALAFFDFPERGLDDYAEVLGGLHQLAISVPPDVWDDKRARLEQAGIEIHQDQTSLYFRDPDGSRIEIIEGPLGEMYGSPVT